MKLSPVNVWLKLPFYYGKLFLLIAQCKYLFLLALLRSRSRPRWIVTWPESPSPFSALYKICHRLGLRITTQAQQIDDVVFAWEDTTVRKTDYPQNRLAPGRIILNGACSDIRKRHVARVFGEVFGYTFEVDPQTYQALMVRKSDANAPHDGTIIQGPLRDDRQDVVYQKLIDNVVCGLVEDLRVPIFGDIIPFCLLKRMAIEDRFTNDTGTGIICETADTLSAGEIADILRFCRAMGLDYGELDVLRNNEDGKIYIVDVNNTPFGPLDRHIQVPWYFDSVAWEALERMSRAFQQAFLQ